MPPLPAPRRPARPHHARARALPRAVRADADAACRPRTTLTGPSLTAWDDAADAVSTALAVPAADADALLARAHGWTPSPYLRSTLTDAVPDPAAVAAALAVLTDDLGLGAEEAAAVVRAFPEALSRDAETQLRANLALLEKQWRMTGAAAAGAVKRTPRILGNTVDCEGDCIGECDRCWVRF